jgi:endoglucanase
VLNKALLLIYAYEQTDNNSYFQIASMQLNYIMGTNAHNISFITGVGTNSVMHPHHRPSVADGVINPVPGLLAGGPDQYLDDPVLQSHFNSSTPPALCYIDDVGSYASNEIAINWNAPLVFVSGYFNGQGSTSVEDQSFNILPDKFELNQNYPNPFNPSTKIKYTIPSVVDAKFASTTMTQLKVFDVLGNEVATLVNEYKPAGNYEVEFNAQNISSGIYFYTLSNQNYSKTKSMVLLK